MGCEIGSELIDALALLLAGSEDILGLALGPAFLEEPNQLVGGDVDEPFLLLLLDSGFLDLDAVVDVVVLE